MHQVGQLGLVVGLGRVVGKSLGHEFKVDVIPVDLTAGVIGAGDNHDPGMASAVGTVSFIKLKTDILSMNCC